MNHDPTIAAQMQALLDNLTKPKGSLGKLEEFALRCAEIQSRVPPRISSKRAYVFAADHGIADEGVSLYPKDVTRQMVLNMLAGGAAINVLGGGCGFDVRTVDAGVAHGFDDPRVIDARIAAGTRSFLREPAMSDEQLARCLEHGRRLAQEAVDDGVHLVTLGDMGIGNTSSAAAMLVAAGFSSGEMVDRGTGISEEMLAHKRATIDQAVERHGPYRDAHQIMRCMGGFELCMIAGFILGLRGAGMICVIDGFPVTAGAYMAWRVDPEVAEFLFAGHRSHVRGHGAVLADMGLEPILQLEMRLGEGTGAVLGGFLIDMAVKVSREMASFDTAGVERSSEDEEDY